jgi:surface polysaccharide O-acyltransferase-like enzyme
MVTGVLLLNQQKEISIEKLLKKYIFRFLTALFIFGIPYAFLELFFNANYQFNIKQIGIAILNVFQGCSWDHIWYLYMIIGLYLIIPLFKIFIAHAEKKTIEYILIILFIFTSVVPTVENILSFKLGFYTSINSVYVFYLILGSYIHQYRISINNILLKLIMIFCFLLLILLSFNKNIIDTTIVNGFIFLNESSPVIVMITVSLFCFMRQNGKANKISDILSPLCFGIYLIHVLFINILFKFLNFTPMKYPFLIIIIGTFVITMGLSVLFTYSARKIAVIRQYIL